MNRLPYNKKQVKRKTKERKKLESRTERESREIFHSFIRQSKIFISSPKEILIVYTDKKQTE